LRRVDHELHQQLVVPRPVGGALAQPGHADATEADLLVDVDGAGVVR
jgi:hypothetical protein